MIRTKRPPERILLQNYAMTGVNVNLKLVSISGGSGQHSDGSLPG